MFAGNSATVCPLEEWLSDDLIQSIAAENNLSETAFFVPDGDGYHLRWFTPTTEVELCGHATLASAFLILTRLSPDADSMRFDTRSGRLDVVRDGDLLFLDFPAYPRVEVTCPQALSDGLSAVPGTVIEGPNYLAVFDVQADVAALDPDMTLLEKLHPRGVIATAPGDDCDFVSRYSAPSFGVPEDSITGSAYCMLIPYGVGRAGKSRLDASQISARGSRLTCEDRGACVGVGGTAVLYLEDRITIQAPRRRQVPCGSAVAVPARAEHAFAVFFRNHVRQHAAEPLDRFRAGISIGVGKALALAFGQASFKLNAIVRELQQALPPVAGAFALLDKAFADQLAEDARQALLGDFQNGEEFGDVNPGIAAHEIDHPVMGAAESVF